MRNVDTLCARELGLQLQLNSRSRSPVVARDSRIRKGTFQDIADGGIT
jgi:hypothetical protein